MGTRLILYRQIWTPTTYLEFCEKMTKCRNICDRHGLVPLYHYTDAELGESILKLGLHMSKQDQGEDGVFLSLLGPASFRVSMILICFENLCVFE